MRRIISRERPNWRDKAAELGFSFHSPGGEPYWDESAFYGFTLREIELGIEQAAGDLHKLCLELVDRVVRDERLLRRLAIPQFAWSFIAESWRRKDPSLYGRFDFSFDGRGPAKLLEYNADTPTSIYEAAVFQWYWYEDCVANGTLTRSSDQFNSLHEALVARWREIAGGVSAHFASYPDDMEDRGTVAYLEDCARQAGLRTRFIAIGDIGLDSEGDFVDLDEGEIRLLFKLYPWEWMFRDQFGKALPRASTRFVEPPWKAILSNKGILPLLWEMAPGHPNLLPAFFEDDPRRGEIGAEYVIKPIYSREGANITLVDSMRMIEGDRGPYGAEGSVRQQLAPLPLFDGNYPVIGAWIVGDSPCGMGVREDKSPITKNTSRFLPHAIIG
ncbi:glutathionylspermidine synthase family protein [Terrarubrum flagellatum]|uniref:glutathionylspermidine synthase family protein n=1 Tax=Terrirubrum flagellatum TaxID=2895980 RepID=UPI00314524C1